MELLRAFGAVFQERRQELHRPRASKIGHRHSLPVPYGHEPRLLELANCLTQRVARGVVRFGKLSLARKPIARAEFPPQDAPSERAVDRFGNVRLVGGLRLGWFRIRHVLSC